MHLIGCINNCFNGDSMKMQANKLLLCQSVSDNVEVEIVKYPSSTRNTKEVSALQFTEQGSKNFVRMTIIKNDVKECFISVFEIVDDKPYEFDSKSIPENMLPGVIATYVNDFFGDL